MFVCLCAYFWLLNVVVFQYCSCRERKERKDDPDVEYLDTDDFK